MIQPVVADLPPSNGKTLLITGITGFVASHLGLLALSKGYSIRGTSRRAKNAQRLVNHAYKGFSSRVEIFEVPDMTIEGSLKEAAQGVHGIFHIASPVNFNLRAYDDVVIPALRGTELLLYAALEAGPQLQSLVFTSSVAAVVDGTKTSTQQVFDEHDFASMAYIRALEAHQSGEQVAPETLYAGSKIAAEQAVWEFRKKEKPQFSLSVIIPGVVIGPIIVPPRSPADLGVSLKPIYDIFAGGLATVPPTIGSGSYIDVRDIAYMHLWAFEHPAITDGARYIGVAGFGATQACADILRKHYPARLDKIPKGTPGHGYKGYADGDKEHVDYPDGRFQISGRKAQKVMGIKWISIRESVLDTVESFSGIV